MAHRTNVYSFAFVGANALVSETIAVGEIFLRTQDWQKTYEIVRTKNLLHKMKEATVIREFREIRKRLSTLTPDQLKLLVEGDRNQARALILLGIVNAYDFIRDFILEVIRQKYLTFERVLFESDYRLFVKAKSAIDPSIQKLSETSSQKVKTVAFRILSQVGLLDDPKKGGITRPILDSRCVETIVSADPQSLRFFLYSEDEISQLMRA